MAVGKEYAESISNISLKERYVMLMESKEKQYSARNQHARGNTNVLRLIFNLGLSKDYETEESCQ
jgi:hypothetical protein